MEINEELDLLKDYMNYFINLRFEKETYFMKTKDFERGFNASLCRPRLKVRSINDLEPLPFQDWMYVASIV